MVHIQYEKVSRIVKHSCEYYDDLITILSNSFWMNLRCGKADKSQMLESKNLQGECSILSLLILQKYNMGLEPGPCNHSDCCHM